MKPEEMRLAYLLISTPLPNVYIGGVMVTDGRGLPVEFRYTEPIQPTKIQQILYGQVLSNYIKAEVILDTLIKSLESKCKNLFVLDDSLLAIQNKGFTVVRIGEAKSASLGEVGMIQETSPIEALFQPTKEGTPIRVQLGDGKHMPDPATNLRTSGVLEILLEASQTMDVYEPLRRIEKALETICQEEGISKIA